VEYTLRDMAVSSSPALNPGSMQSQSSDKTPGELVDRVVSSRVFERAPTLRRLLLYLWEHRADNINEYAIATEALGRKADFEPRLDATVRVLVSRLRQRLNEFYESDGCDSVRRLVIPLGTHQIQIVEAECPSASVLSEPVAVDPNSVPSLMQRLGRNQKILWAQSFVIFLLVISLSWALWERNRVREESARGFATRLPAFWRQFLDNGKNTRIVVPNPVFFGWNNGLMVRDLNVNDFSKLGESEPLSKLNAMFGRPELAQQYVSWTDAFSALNLDRFLDPEGNRFLISTTAESSPDVLSRQNLIVAGTPRTLVLFQDFLDRLSFQVDAVRGRVLDRKPIPGRPLAFDTVYVSKSQMSTPGVIASVPGGPNGTHILLLVTTYYTSALVSYLTSEDGLKELRSAQHAHGDTPYFEAVILSDINGDTELRSRLAEFRTFDPTK